MYGISTYVMYISVIYILFVLLRDSVFWFSSFFLSFLFYLLNFFTTTLLWKWESRVVTLSFFCLFSYLFSHIPEANFLILYLFVAWSFTKIKETWGPCFHEEIFSICLQIHFLKHPFFCMYTIYFLYVTYRFEEKGFWLLGFSKGYLDNQKPHLFIFIRFKVSKKRYVLIFSFLILFSRNLLSSPLLLFSSSNLQTQIPISFSPFSFLLSLISSCFFCSSSNFYLQNFFSLQLTFLQI